MARFLTTRGTTAAIEDIINNADKSIVLVSPFVKISESLFQNMLAADKREVRITLIFGKKRLDDEVITQFQVLRNLSVYFLKNLHAKCYFNEYKMIITSLNLYDFSEQNNREMGMLISRQEDQELFSDAVKEVQRCIDFVKPYELKIPSESSSTSAVTTITEKTNSNNKNKSRVPNSLGDILQGFSDIVLGSLGLKQGYCIGCGTKIEYDEFRPYCTECYKKWVANKKQKAKYCHVCGNEKQTSMNKPVCRSCWNRSKQFR